MCVIYIVFEIFLWCIVLYGHIHCQISYQLVTHLKKTINYVLTTSLAFILFTPLYLCYIRNSMFVNLTYLFLALISLSKQCLVNLDLQNVFNFIDIIT